MHLGLTAGEEGLHEELRAVGVATEGLAVGVHTQQQQLYNVPPRPEIQAVVAGMDQHFSMLKLSMVQRVLLFDDFIGDAVRPTAGLSLYRYKPRSLCS